MNAHFHFHVCVIDGVFCEDPEGSVQFHEATHLTASDWNQLEHTVRHRVLRTTLRAVPSTAAVWSNVTSPMTCSPGRPPVASASMPRSRSLLTTELGSNAFCAGYPPKVGGARPPFALERMEATGYGVPGRIVYRLPHPAPDGATALSLAPLEPRTLPDHVHENIMDDPGGHLHEKDVPAHLDDLVLGRDGQGRSQRIRRESLGDSRRHRFASDQTLSNARRQCLDPGVGIGRVVCLDQVSIP
ncbi:MAG: transposase [Gemmatimonadetes bacterium]|nr:transposase [Gemmatimonadota bacterium]